jgi:NADH-quinone oxidoreductase subunit L
VATDIKRVLAYSTISQLGYMVFAIGVQAYAAAIFHLVTHAFFKALLFLGAGSVIHGLGGEQDLRKMGGLAPRMVGTTITMGIGAWGLAGLPPLAGFFSKDAILAAAFADHRLIWALLLVGAFLTAFYTFRLYFLAFTGGPRMSKEVAHHIHESPTVMLWPLIILAALTVVAGFVGIPSEHGSAITRFLSAVFPPHEEAHGGFAAYMLIVVAIVVAAGGLMLASAMYFSRPVRPGEIGEARTPLHALLLNAYYIDAVYDRLVVRPLLVLSAVLAWVVDVRVVDALVDLSGRAVVSSAGWLRRLQTGYSVNYALTMLAGAVLLVGFLLTR